MRVLILAALIVAASYFLHASQTITDGLAAMEPTCASALGARAPKLASPVCGAVGALAHTLNQAVGEVSTAMTQIAGGIQQKVGQLLSYGQQESLQHASDEFRHLSTLISQPGIAAAASSVSGLQVKLQQGAAGANTGNASLQNATDDYVLGLHFLRGDAGQTALARSWFEQGANQQHYGVLSQVALAQMYAGGTGGVPSDPAQAQHYYTQALQSLTNLNNSNGSPEAQQVLATLPGGSTAQLQQQIQAALAQLKASVKH